MFKINKFPFYFFLLFSFFSQSFQILAMEMQSTIGTDTFNYPESRLSSEILRISFAESRSTSKNYVQLLTGHYPLPNINSFLKELAVFKKIYHVYPQLPFGLFSPDSAMFTKLYEQANALDESSLEYQNKMQQLEKLSRRLKTFFDVLNTENITIGQNGKAFTFKNAIDHVNAAFHLKSPSLEEMIDIAVSFRHLTSDWQYLGMNQLGDYIAEMILIEHVIPLLNTENSKITSEVYYELSQIYSHLIDYGSKVVWEGTSGHLQLPFFQGSARALPDAKIKYEDIIWLKLSLLLRAVKNNDSHPSAYGRILEFMFHDIEENEALLKLVPEHHKLARLFNFQGTGIEEIIGHHFSKMTMFEPRWIQYCNSSFAVKVLRKAENVSLNLAKIAEAKEQERRELARSAERASALVARQRPEPSDSSSSQQMLLANLRELALVSRRKPVEVNESQGSLQTNDSSNNTSTILVMRQRALNSLRERSSHIKRKSPDKATETTENTNELHDKGVLRIKRQRTEVFASPTSDKKTEN